MPADAPADAGEPLRRTTADAKNPQKMAADAFPAFEKYKVIESNPPCGCPMGCVAHCMGERGFSAVSSPSLGDAFVLRSSLLPTCGFHASFQTWPCLDSPSGLASQTWPCHILGSHKGWFLRNRCLPHVDVLKGGFFHSSSCHACLGQASVSLGAPRMPTNLLHHGPQNRIQKTSRNMAARKGPRLYCAPPRQCMFIYRSYIAAATMPSSTSFDVLTSLECAYECSPFVLAPFFLCQPSDDLDDHVEDILLWSLAWPCVTIMSEAMCRSPQWGILNTEAAVERKFLALQQGCNAKR